ncbi:hypothetical protein B0H14DRAFT_3453206 [Mycena olivaceomarginata]|nr:hypothetical protein B0H14DRAFT_3453206 [Mycena olivaceomarginata]
MKAGLSSDPALAKNPPCSMQMLMGHPRIHPSPPPPAGLFPFLADEWTRDCVSIVSFSEKHTAGGMFNDYTARYRAVREEDRITLRQSMFSETIDDPQVADTYLPRAHVYGPPALWA